MSAVNFKDGLSSTRRTEILDAVYASGGRREPLPSNSEINSLLLLLKHTDADIREVAVNVAGIHWRLPEAYPIIRDMALRGESDQSVLISVCDALGSLFDKGIGELKEVSRILLTFVINTGFDPDLRGTAYLSLRRIHKHITIQEFASAPRDINKLQIDSDWIITILKSLL